jgi:hypothetical protein
MNDTQLLERLSDAYATLDAPAPNASLAVLLETGRSVDDDTRDAVVVPLVRPRPTVQPSARVRVRHLVAATVATFVLFGGLAVAGALPDPVQRGVASVVSHLGIDLPSSDPAPTRVPDPPHSSDRSPSDRSPSDQSPSTPTRSSTPSSAATGTEGAGAPDAAARAGGDASTPGTTASAAGRPLGQIGTVSGAPATAPTTLPPTLELPSGDGLLPPLPLPPIAGPSVTVPQLTLPPVTVPQLTLPPVTLPEVTLPPVTLPTLPLPLDLPVLGL